MLRHQINASTEHHPLCANPSRSSQLVFVHASRPSQSAQAIHHEALCTFPLQRTIHQYVRVPTAWIDAPAPGVVQVSRQSFTMLFVAILPAILHDALVFSAIHDAHVFSAILHEDLFSRQSITIFLCQFSRTSITFFLCQFSRQSFTMFLCQFSRQSVMIFLCQSLGDRACSQDCTSPCPCL